MYKLILADGSELHNLGRINPGTFYLESTDPQVYWMLSDENLAFATLYKDEELDEIFMDYTMTSYCAQAGTIQFRIVPVQTLAKEKEHQVDKARKDKSKKKFMVMAEKEIEKKG